MFTICYAVFASLTAVTPDHSVCVRVPEKLVASARAACDHLNADPLTMCESRRVGALKYFITVRQLGGG